MIANDQQLAIVSRQLRELEERRDRVLQEPTGAPFRKQIEAEGTQPSRQSAGARTADLIRGYGGGSGQVTLTTGHVLRISSRRASSKSTRHTSPRLGSGVRIDIKRFAVEHCKGRQFPLE